MRVVSIRINCGGTRWLTRNNCRNGRRVGIALTSSCGRLTVATFLALLLKMKVANVEQRLYEWCLEVDDKAGTQRQSVDVISTKRL